MKRSKKLIVAVVVAMVLIFAMSATAFAAAPVVSVDNSSPASGDTVKFTVKMGTGDVAIQGNVTASPNLTFVSVSNTNFATDGAFMLMDGMVTEIVYTYTVSGNANDAFSFALSNVETSTDGTTLVPYDGSVSATGAIAAAVVDENPEPQQPAPTPPAEDKKDTLPDNGDASQDMLVWSVIAAAVLGAVGFTAYRKAFSK